MKNEVWKWIPGYENNYKVSSFGRVMSYKYNKTRLIKISPQKNGYFYAGLCIKCFERKYKTSVLVAMAFLNHVPSGSTRGLVVDHIDNDKSNNNLSNIQLITQRENSSKNTSGLSKYTGVCWHDRGKKWVGQIKLNGVMNYLGLFNTEIEAANAYKAKLAEFEREIEGHRQYL